MFASFSHFRQSFQVRCDVLDRLRDILHLLSLPEEKEMTHVLEMCLSGGLPNVDESSRDTSDILDAAALVLDRPRERVFVWTHGSR